MLRGSLNAGDLSLTQLRCFLAVVEAGSFAEAGRRLGLSTSVVSKTIARMEAVHGVRLLHRSTHAVSPTQEGRTLLDPAHSAAEALAEMGRALEHAAGLRGGMLRVTAPVALLRHCLTPLLPAFRQAHPEIHLDLRASNKLLDLVSHGIDVAIRTGSLEGVPGHVQQRWFAAPWVICAAPSYLAQRAAPATPADLAVHDLIGFRPGEDGLVRPWRFRHPETGAVERFAPAPMLIFDDGETGWRAALDGLGIACAPLFLAADALRDGRMVELLRPWRDAAMPVSILRRETRLTPARVAQFIDFLKQRPPVLDTD